MLKVSLVSVPVRNQERALIFYTEKLGFKLETDAAFEEGKRWIELSSPDGDTRVALFTVSGQEDRIGTFSNVVFSCDDVQKVYEVLKSRGVEFAEVPKKQPWGGTIATFKDVDGNTFCLSSME